MATSTSGASPGVVMSWSEMWTWNADTPAIVPAGARISAGKSGSVARSFPNSAEALVKRSPVSCIPSPESPAKRMMTRSTVSVRTSSDGLVDVSDTLVPLGCRGDVVVAATPTIAASPAAVREPEDPTAPGPRARDGQATEAS